MPFQLNAPVLTVDVVLIHKVDTRTVENLFRMWRVFSRCAGSLHQGRRLENWSWRLLNSETFCCDPFSEANRTMSAISISAKSLEEAIAFDNDPTSASTSAPVDITRPQIQRQDSVLSPSRGRERHITLADLEKTVTTIKKQDLQPLSLSNLPPLAPLAPATTIHTPQLITPVVESKSLTSDGASDHSAQPASSGNCTSKRNTTSVVHVFSPSHVSSSYRSTHLPTAPSSIPTADITATKSTNVQPPAKKQQMFALGGSSGEDSLSEQTNSMENSVQPIAPQLKKKLQAKFSFGGSSNEDESSLPQKMKIHSALANTTNRVTSTKKQTSFKEEVEAQTIKEERVFDDDVFETDEDEIDESAIDDDNDSSDWEDSIEDSGKPSIDEKTFFQRVESRPNLTSRRSLITTMLHQNDRANALTTTTAASRSTSALQRSRTSLPNGPSLAASLDLEDNLPPMRKKGLKPISEVPRSQAQPIVRTTTKTTAHPLALSPRTTRRNMLASELSVSLRQHLIWERKQKSQTANAILKRRRVNPKQCPEEVYMNQTHNDNSSCTDYYDHGLDDYHTRGW